jgi:hypothetical protein
LFQNGQSELGQNNIREQRLSLQENIAKFGGEKGLIDNKEKYKVLVSEKLFKLSAEMQE